MEKSEIRIALQRIVELQSKMIEIMSEMQRQHNINSLILERKEKNE